MKRAARKQSALPRADVAVWPCSRCSSVCTSRIGRFVHQRTHRWCCNLSSSTAQSISLSVVRLRSRQAAARCAEKMHGGTSSESMCCTPHLCPFVGVHLHLLQICWNLKSNAMCVCVLQRTAVNPDAAVSVSRVLVSVISTQRTSFHRSLFQGCLGPSSALQCSGPGTLLPGVNGQRQQVLLLQDGWRSANVA